MEERNDEWGEGCHIDGKSCIGCGDCDDEPDYDPADHLYGLGDPGFPPGHFTKGPDGKSPSDRIAEILNRPGIDEDEIAF